MSAKAYEKCTRRATRTDYFETNFIFSSPYIAKLFTFKRLINSSEGQCTPHSRIYQNKTEATNFRTVIDKSIHAIVQFCSMLCSLLRKASFINQKYKYSDTGLFLTKQRACYIVDTRFLSSILVVFRSSFT